MKIASVLGGGIAGVGEVCGAVSGAVISLGLSFGTYGNEPLDIFKLKRTRTRDIIRDLMNQFTAAWGALQCRILLAMDEGKLPPLGSCRNEDTPRKRCSEYVDWTVMKTVDLLNENSEK